MSTHEARAEHSNAPQVVPRNHLLRHFRTLHDLQPADHVSCLYCNAAEREELLVQASPALPRIVTYFLVVNDVASPSPTCVALPITEELSGEALVTYLRQQVTIARADGASQVRFLIDIADLGLCEVEGVLAHEQAMSQFVADTQAIVVCLWDRQRLSEDLLLTALRIHRQIATSSEMYENTGYCRDTADCQSMVNWYLEDLAQWHRLRRHQRRHSRLIHSLWNTACTMILVLDAQGRILRFNRVAEELVGYKAEEVVGRIIWEFLMPSAVVAELRERLAGLGTTTEPSEGETVLLTRNGRHLSVIWSASPLLDDDGTIGSVLISAFDVTTPRETQHALRTSIRRYRELVENVNSIIMETDLHGRVTFFNEFAEQFFGYSQSEVLGREVAGLLLPDIGCVADLRQFIEQIGEECTDYQSGETEALLRDGRRVWLHWTIRVIYDAYGEPSGLLAVGSDITRRKTTEQKLQASEQRFRELADMLPDMIYEARPDGIITYANQTTLNSLGYTLEDLPNGYSIYDMVSEEDLPQAYAATRRLLEGRSTDSHQYSLRRHDGHFVPVEVHSAPIRDGDGRLLGFRGVIRDIGERKKLEDAQRMAALGQLAAGVAHEFNNILAAIFGWAELARHESTTTTQRRLVDTVIAGATRGADICKKLIRYARPTEPTRTPLRLEEPLQAALAIAERELEKAEIEVVCDFAQNAEYMLGDSGQLEQVFLNLIINARHAMARGGRLTVKTGFNSVAGGASEVTATITDTGAGINSNDLSRIFEPFFSTKTLDRSEFGGSGLGLSVSHSIVKAHGGTISVQSREGQGTTFTLRFAAFEGPVKETAPQLAPDWVQGSSTTTGYRILVADDEQAILEILEAVLGEHGHQVEAVTSTDEALQALRQQTFDLLITDLVMPGGGGNELLAFTQKLRQPPPILLITGLIEDDQLHHMMRNGVSRCLRKPFSLQELVTTVEGLLPLENRRV